MQHRTLLSTALLVLPLLLAGCTTPEPRPADEAEPAPGFWSTEAPLVAVNARSTCGFCPPPSVDQPRFEVLAVYANGRALHVEYDLDASLSGSHTLYLSDSVRYPRLEVAALFDPGDATLRFGVAPGARQVHVVNVTPGHLPPEAMARLVHALEANWTAPPEHAPLGCVDCRGPGAFGRVTSTGSMEVVVEPPTNVSLGGWTGDALDRAKRFHGVMNAWSGAWDAFLPAEAPEGPPPEPTLRVLEARVLGPNATPSDPVSLQPNRTRVHSATLAAFLDDAAANGSARLEARAATGFNPVDDAWRVVEGHTTWEEAEDGRVEVLWRGEVLEVTRLARQGASSSGTYQMVWVHGVEGPNEDPGLRCSTVFLHEVHPERRTIEYSGHEYDLQGRDLEVLVAFSVDSRWTGCGVHRELVPDQPRLHRSVGAFGNLTLQLQPNGTLVVDGDRVGAPHTLEPGGNVTFHYGYTTDTHEGPRNGSGTLHVEHRGAWPEAGLVER